MTTNDLSQLPAGYDDQASPMFIPEDLRPFYRWEPTQPAGVYQSRADARTFSRAIAKLNAEDAAAFWGRFRRKFNGQAYNPENQEHAEYVSTEGPGGLYFRRTERDRVWEQEHSVGSRETVLEMIHEDMLAEARAAQVTDAAAKTPAPRCFACSRELGSQVNAARFDLGWAAPALGTADPSSLVEVQRGIPSSHGAVLAKCCGDCLPIVEVELVRMAGAEVLPSGLTRAQTVRRALLG